MLEKLKKKYIDVVGEDNISDFAYALFDEYKLYIKDEEFLFLVLFLKAYDEFLCDLKYLNISDSLKEKCEIFYRLKNLDEDILSEYENIWPLVVMYLLIIKKHVELYGDSVFDDYFGRKNIEYALMLLSYADVFELRDFLEDKFFAYLDPEIFNHYNSILKFSRDSYVEHEKIVIDVLINLLKDKNILAMVESRVKTIYSIHRKITQKNLLFSQVLDTVGVRIIVGTEEECYDLMQLILKSFPVLNTKIKDYISIPKTNGYQSIHITVIINQAPVEIQIRTVEMHGIAKFGSAAHRRYKNAKRNNT